MNWEEQLAEVNGRVKLTYLDALASGSTEVEFPSVLYKELSEYVGSTPEQVEALG